MKNVIQGAFRLVATAAVAVLLGMSPCAALVAQGDQGGSGETAVYVTMEPTVAEGVAPDAESDGANADELSGGGGMKAGFPLTGDAVGILGFVAACGFVSSAWLVFVCRRASAEG